MEREFEVWEEIITGNLYRIRVPGGYLYKDIMRDRERKNWTVAMCFVPFPPDKQEFV